MICGYGRKVYLGIPADCFEDAGPVHPVIHRLHDLGLHDDKNEDGNVYGNEQVSVQGMEGRRATKFLPKTRERDIWVRVKAFWISARHR